jgi:hypothetical protein
MFTIEPEILVGLGGFIGTAVGAFAAVKKWPFWKNYNDGRQSENIKLTTLDHCPDTSCHDIVIVTATEVRGLKEGQTEIFDRINELPNEFIKALKDTKELFRS